MDEDFIIKDIRKSSTERIRIALRSYKGSSFLDIRIFYDTSGKETAFKPSSKGITFQLPFLPELSEAIKEGIKEVEAWSKEDTE